MRIIAGQWRSRRLVRPDTSNTRPMPDRVKGAVFDILGTRLASPGLLPPLRIADVFAGSGSMGLEALSRGARSCCFFEHDHEALAALRQNLDSLRVGEAATVVTWDAWRHGVSTADGEPFDLLFLDPPYRDSEDTSETGAVSRYLTRLAAIHRSSPLVVFHHRATVRFQTSVAERWQVVDCRTFGTHTVTFLEL